MHNGLKIFIFIFFWGVLIWADKQVISVVLLYSWFEKKSFGISIFLPEPLGRQTIFSWMKRTSCPLRFSHKLPEWGTSIPCTFTCHFHHYSFGNSDRSLLELDFTEMYLCGRRFGLEGLCFPIFPEIPLSSSSGLKNFKIHWAMLHLTVPFFFYSDRDRGIVCVPQMPGWKQLCCKKKTRDFLRCLEVMQLCFHWHF